jgi:STE24 endopeptidase
LYLWFTLFPGKIDPLALQLFGFEQVQKGKVYSIVPRVSYILSFLLQVSCLVWLFFSGRIHGISSAVLKISRGSEWVSILIIVIAIWFLLKLLSFPFNLYSQYFWQHQWGFSNQSLGVWLLDDFKTSLLDFGLTVLGGVLLFGLFKHWPRTWWAVGGSFFAVWLVFQSLLWPVLVAPLFNNFSKVENPQIVAMVKDLAKNSGLNVNQILVMDASQRTTKANAYFAGVGSTQRIVLYDTLLRDYDLGEIKAVIAHEMAHWKFGHILKGLFLGILGSFLLWRLAFWVLNALFPTGKYSLEALPIFLLFFLLMSFISSPLQNYVSRQMEIQADILAVQLTEDVPSAVRLQRDLAARNLADVSPPSFIKWFSYTHPPALTRIETIQELSRN